MSAYLSLLALKEVVDIYTKLVIAVFGFIAPTITILLPILEKRIKGVSALLQIQEDTLVSIQKDLNSKYIEKFAGIEDQKLKEVLVKQLEKYNDKSLKVFNGQIKETKKKLKYLNLKHQIKTIIGLLFLALAFICLYHLSRANLYHLFGNNKGMQRSCCFIFPTCSSTVFYWCLFTLWRIFCVMLQNVDQVGVQIFGDQTQKGSRYADNSTENSDVQIS